MYVITHEYIFNNKNKIYNNLHTVSTRLNYLMQNLTVSINKKNIEEIL